MGAVCYQQRSRHPRSFKLLLQCLASLQRVNDVGVEVDDENGALDLVDQRMCESDRVAIVL